MKKILNTILIFSFLLFNANFVMAKYIDETKQEILALYSANHLEEAYEMISALTEEERDYELWYILGNISQDFNNYTNAIFFLQKSTILNPSFDKAHYNLANIYLKEKRYNSAIEEYKVATKLKKDFPYYWYNMGCAYLGLKEYSKAKSAFNKAIKLNGSEPDFYYNLALAYKNLNNTKKAQENLDIYNKLVKEK